MKWKVSYEIDLITTEQYQSLPMGTVLYDIFGKLKTKSEDSDDPKSPNYIDQDTRGGYLAYGFRIPGILD